MCESGLQRVKARGKRGEEAQSAHRGMGIKEWAEASPREKAARQQKYKVRTIPFLRQLKKMIEVRPRGLCVTLP